MSAMDATDKALLDIIQADFPLVPRPYAYLGEKLGIGEEEVLERVRRLREEHIIRRMGRGTHHPPHGSKLPVEKARLGVHSLRGKGSARGNGELLRACECRKGRDPQL